MSHDITGFFVIKFEDIGDHLGLAGLQDPLLVALIDHVLNIFFGYIFLPGFYKPPDCNACCQEKQNHACQKDQARIAIVHTDLVISFFSHSVYTIHF